MLCLAEVLAEVFGGSVRRKRFTNLLRKCLANFPRKCFALYFCLSNTLIMLLTVSGVCVVLRLWSALWRKFRGRSAEVPRK